MTRRILGRVPVLPAVATAAALGLGGSVGVAAFSGEREPSRVPAVELSRSDPSADPTPSPTPSPTPAPSPSSSPVPAPEATEQQDPGSPTMGPGAREVPPDPLRADDDDGPDDGQDDDGQDDDGQDDDGNGDDDGGDDGGDD